MQLLQLGKMPRLRSAYLLRRLYIVMKKYKGERAVGDHEIGLEKFLKPKNTGPKERVRITITVPKEALDDIRRIPWLKDNNPTEISKAAFMMVASKSRELLEQTQQGEENDNQ